VINDRAGLGRDPALVARTVEGTGLKVNVEDRVHAGSLELVVGGGGDGGHGR
jgi:hypothetical protein